MVFLAIVRPHLGSTQKEKYERGTQIYVCQLRPIVGSLGHVGQLFTKSIVCSPFFIDDSQRCQTFKTLTKNLRTKGILVYALVFFERCLDQSWSKIG